MTRNSAPSHAAAESALDVAVRAGGRLRAALAHCAARVPRGRVRGEVAALAAMALVLAAPSPAWGQAFPVKPIRFIVAYAPGGAADPIARLVGQRLSETIGQPVVVENHAGAGGNIGSDMVAKAVPDGHTILMVAASTVTINQSLYPKMPFDPIRDFAPVGLTAMDAIILVTHPAFPAKTVQEIVDLARAKPGQVNYASGGLGSGGHLAMELLKSMTNTNIVHIPFKGAGNSLPSLLSGEVSMTATSAGSVLSYVNQGRLRAIAATSIKRLPNLPNLPTIDESGVPGYDVTGWYGVLAPAKTPAAVVARLNAEITKIVQEPTVRERIGNMGLIPATSTPAELAKIIQTDSEKWGKVVRQANIKME